MHFLCVFIIQPSFLTEFSLSGQPVRFCFHFTFVSKAVLACCNVNACVIVFIYMFIYIYIYLLMPVSSILRASSKQQNESDMLNNFKVRKSRQIPCWKKRRCVAYVKGSENNVQETTNYCFLSSKPCVFHTNSLTDHPILCTCHVRKKFY